MSQEVLDRLPIIKDIRKKAVEKKKAEIRRQEEEFWLSEYGQYLLARERLDQAMHDPDHPYRPPEDGSS